MDLLSDRADFRRMVTLVQKWTHKRRDVRKSEAERQEQFRKFLN